MSDQVEFCKLVLRMRRLQKAYFANQTRLGLESAKAAEARVDKWLERYKIDQVQYGLFGRSEKSSEIPGQYDVGGEGGQDDD